jgi:hypothetical protein
MTAMKDLRPQISGQKKPGKQARTHMEEKMFLEAGIAPDETHSQDADRHQNIAHQKSAR